MKTKKTSYGRQLNPLAPPHCTALNHLLVVIPFEIQCGCTQMGVQAKDNTIDQGEKNKHKHHQGHLLLSDNFSDRTIGMILSSWFELILCSIGFQHQYSGLLWHNDQKSEHPRQNKVLSFPSQRWSGIMVKNAALLNNSICLWRKHTWLFIPFFKGCVLRGIFLFSNSFWVKSLQ